MFYYRYLTGFITNFFVLKKLKETMYIGKRKDFLLLILNGVIGFFSFYAYVIAVENIPLSIASMLFMMGTIWVTLFAPFFLGEKIKYLYIFLALICLFGLVLIIKPPYLFNQD